MRRVYLDNYAACPVLQEVLEAMMPFYRENFGNPSSLHSWGDKAREAVENARENVAALIGASPEEIIFTSGGTESNNMAIKGIARALRKKGNHIVISAIEHFSVMHAARTLEKEGFELTIVGVDNNGLVDPSKVREAVNEKTVLASVMTANGEIGTIQPIREIAMALKGSGVVFHTDAVAAAGTMRLDVNDLGVSALSIASDMLFGPKGVGALYVKKGQRIMPLLDGGVQEGGRRAGTENVPGIVGMGKACEIAVSEIESRAENFSSLRDKLIKEIPKAIPHVRLTGHPTMRLPWNASFAVEFIEGESMLLLLDQEGIAASSGSACTSRALKVSHVLDACNIPAEIAQGSILFSIGHETNEGDIDYVIEKLPPIVERLRKMSPLYDKFLKGGGQNSDL